MRRGLRIRQFETAEEPRKRPAAIGYCGCSVASGGLNESKATWRSDPTTRCGRALRRSRSRGQDVVTRRRTGDLQSRWWRREQRRRGVRGGRGRRRRGVRERRSIGPLALAGFTVCWRPVLGLQQSDSDDQRFWSFWPPRWLPPWFDCPPWFPCCPPRFPWPGCPPKSPPWPCVLSRSRSFLFCWPWCCPPCWPPWLPCPWFRVLSPMDSLPCSFVAEEERNAVQDREPMSLTDSAQVVTDVEWSAQVSDEDARSAINRSSNSTAVLWRSCNTSSSAWHCSVMLLRWTRMVRAASSLCESDTGSGSPRTRNAARCTSRPQRSIASICAKTSSSSTSRSSDCLYGERWALAICATQRSPRSACQRFAFFVVVRFRSCVIDTSGRPRSANEMP